MKNYDEKLAWELQAYGCPQAQIDEQIEDYRDPLMYAAGLLSDAQEAMSPEFYPDGISAKRSNVIRQMINRAKYIIFKVMKDEREAAEEAAAV